jgi:pimeloyl-ACP methyl ester carboxylesterase
METIREQALVLGARDSLVGILTLPTAPSVASDVPTVVILNAGIIHRVGPNRLHVTLARVLASRGFPVLRFDLSGVGDSGNRVDTLSPIEAALADIREALDDLEAAGRTRRGVVLVGLCSGAAHALLSAEVDQRVVGLIPIDLYIPRTAGYYLRHYGSRVVKLQAWLNFVCGRHPVWRALKRRFAPPARGDEGTEADTPPLSRRRIQAILERAFRAALERGVRLLGVFTAGMEKQHNYREQLLDAFPRVPFGRLLRLEYFSNADHTFSAEAERTRLIRLVEFWTQTTPFPLLTAPESLPPAAEPWERPASRGNPVSRHQSASGCGGSAWESNPRRFTRTP